jgi:putative ABC transport system ATP-binding protein
MDSNWLMARNAALQQQKVTKFPQSKEKRVQLARRCCATTPAARCMPGGTRHIVGRLAGASRWRWRMTALLQSAAPLVALDDVHLRLSSAAGPVDILRGVSLEIAAGETVSLVGPSGSGKTSLMLVLAGLERPSSGRVSVDDRDLGKLGEDALARWRRGAIGIVFQSFHLIQTMTALENVAVPLELAGRRDAFAAAGECLAAVGLADRLGHYPAQLSGGEQQRVAIARAFVAGPKLILADEPTGNLDAATGQRAIDCLFEHRRRHDATLLLITHDAGLAERCGRRIGMLDGRIVDDPPRLARPAVARRAL